MQTEDTLWPGAIGADRRASGAKARVPTVRVVPLASKVVESQTRRQEKALEMGWIGRMFGSHEEKPGNIAGAAIIVSLALLAMLFLISYFYPNTNGVPVGELMTLFGGIVTLALGYLFGKSGKD